VAGGERALRESMKQQYMNAYESAKSRSVKFVNYNVNELVGYYLKTYKFMALRFLDEDLKNNKVSNIKGSAAREILTKTL